MPPPVLTPPPLPVPAKGQSQAEFDAAIDAFMAWLQVNNPEFVAALDYVEVTSDAVIAAALAGDLPDLTGQAGRGIRVNDTEDGVATEAFVVQPDLTGLAGQSLLVNPAEDGLAFGEVPVLLASQDLAGQTEFRFTGFDGARFGSYIFYLSNLTEGIRYRSSTDAITYDGGASDYSFNNQGSNPVASNAASSVFISSGLTDTSVSYSGNIWMPHPDGVTPTVLRAETFGRDTGGPDRADTIFYRNSTAEIQGVEFEAAGVNFPSGLVTVYGNPR